MNPFSRMGLGTVQFGLDYGISNTAGRPGDTEISAIMARAAEVGFGYIDTAPGYGEAEQLVGKYSEGEPSLRIVTKTPVFDTPVLIAADGAAIVAHLHQSLRRLNRNHLYGLLIHHTDMLLRPGHEFVLEALETLKADKLVRKIGVSIYDRSELESVLEIFKPDLVQLPLNVLDQRFAQDGSLKELKSLGIEVHVRSLFLQGLLLLSPCSVPENFGPLRAELKVVADAFRGSNLTPLEGCLLFGAQQSDVDAMIMGINSISEIEEIVSAIHKVEGGEHDFDALASANSHLINPANWPIVQ